MRIGCGGFCEGLDGGCGDNNCTAPFRLCQLESRIATDPTAGAKCLLVAFHPPAWFLSKLWRKSLQVIFFRTKARALFAEFHQITKFQIMIKKMREVVSENVEENEECSFEQS